MAPDQASLPETATLAPAGTAQGDAAPLRSVMAPAGGHPGFLLPPTFNAASTLAFHMHAVLARAGSEPAN